MNLSDVLKTVKKKAAASSPQVGMSKEKEKTKGKPKEGIKITTFYEDVPHLSKELGAERAGCVYMVWVTLQKEVFRNRINTDSKIKEMALKGCVKLPYSYLSADLSFHRKSLIGFIKDLERLQFIAVERQKSSTHGNEANIYTLLRGFYSQSRDLSASPSGTQSLVS